MARLGWFVIPRDKLSRYLLDLEHPEGGSKARFFIGRGFSPERPGELAAALNAHVTSPLTTRHVATMPSGGTERRFVLEGPLSAPDGTDPRVKAIWRFDDGSDTAYFVTAYPARPRS